MHCFAGNLTLCFVQSLKLYQSCSLEQTLLGLGVVLHERHTLTQIQHSLSLSLEVDTPSRFRESMNNSRLIPTKTLALSLKTPASVTGVK